MTRSSEKTDLLRIRRLRRRPLGQYRYVRLRWRVTFAVIDRIGTAVFAAARVLQRWATGRTAVPPGTPPDPKVILLVQLDHLGDAIISTAMLPALRARYPQASIEVLSGAWNREMFEALPEVDRVHVSRVNRFARTGLPIGGTGNILLRMGRLAWIPATFYWGLILRRRKVELGIDVRGEFPVALILWLCGARRRLGWECGGGGFLLTDSAEFEADRPEVESRAALLAALGIPPPPSGLQRPSFHPSAAARRRIAQALAELSGHEPTTGPLVVLHIGAGTPAKAWPVEHWRELLGRIIVSHGAQVLLVGSPRDRIIADRILGGRAWPGVADWTGRLSIVELAALFERADVLVGTDSGPAHLAAAVSTAVVVLFSGTNSPRQWRPCGQQVRLLRHDVGCSPCHRAHCPRSGHPCMRLLQPRQVAAEVEQVLLERGGHSERRRGGEEVRR
jgi:lipopolysaccharide heptosyltransferase II